MLGQLLGGYFVCWIHERCIHMLERFDMCDLAVRVCIYSGTLLVAIKSKYARLMRVNRKVRRD